jgi:hypothetical protein
MSKKLKENSNRVWLAGLGALAVAEQEGNDLFQQLVKKGRQLERQAEKALVGPSRIEALKPEKLSPLNKRQHPNERWVRTGKEGWLVVKVAKRGGSEKVAGHPESSPLHAFLPEEKEKGEIELRQARRLAAARRAFLKEFGSLDSVAVDWERLREERRIFVVAHRGGTYIPSFQFDEKGKPRPAVARVIQILGKDTSDWGLALWFTAASSRLDGKRPVDLLSSHPEEVIQAAEQEAAELVF